MTAFEGPPRVILFPGLGADARMFEAQRAALANIETPAWIPHIAGESLRQYAGRLATTLNVREPAALGGVSMGGMVALEVARVVPARCVILIASGRRSSEVNPLLRWGERLSRVIPTIVLDKARVLAPIALGRGGGISSEQRRLLARMACEMPADFLRWAGRAVLDWEGCEDPGVPVHHIHGSRDWVFPSRRVRPDRVITDGVHVLNLSHPREVNEFIAEHSGLEIREPRQ